MKHQEATRGRGGNHSTGEDKPGADGDYNIGSALTHTPSTVPQDPNTDHEQDPTRLCDEQAPGPDEEIRQ